MTVFRKMLVWVVVVALMPAIQGADDRDTNHSFILDATKVETDIYVEKTLAATMGEAPSGNLASLIAIAQRQRETQDRPCVYKIGLVPEILRGLLGIQSTRAKNLLALCSADTALLEGGDATLTTRIYKAHSKGTCRKLVTLEQPILTPKDTLFTTSEPTVTWTALGKKMVRQVEDSEEAAPTAFIVETKADSADKGGEDETSSGLGVLPKASPIHPKLLDAFEESKARVTQLQRFDTTGATYISRAFFSKIEKHPNAKTIVERLKKEAKKIEAKQMRMGKFGIQRIQPIPQDMREELGLTDSEYDTGIASCISFGKPTTEKTNLLTTYFYDQHGNSLGTIVQMLRQHEDGTLTTTIKKLSGKLAASLKKGESPAPATAEPLDITQYVQAAITEELEFAK